LGDREGLFISETHPRSNWIYRRFFKKFNSADDLKNCPLERAAIERMLTIIGEAAKNISPRIREEYPDLSLRERSQG
jgi:uncharacterized protein with HEPN domain